MTLIDISYLKEDVPVFSDGFDWFISVMSKSRAFLSGDQSDPQDIMMQLVAD